MGPKRKYTEAERAVIRAEFLKPWHVRKRELEARALRWAASTPELEPAALALLRFADRVEHGEVEIPVPPYPFSKEV